MKQTNYRKTYERVMIFSTIPVYVFLLIAIIFEKIPLTQEPFARYYLLGSVPLLLLSLYLTSLKKIFRQRTGDCIQIIIFSLIIAAGNTYWGGPMRMNGPLFYVFILLIPFFSLLMDSFLLYFIAGFIGSVTIAEFLIKISEASTLSIVDLVFKTTTLLIVTGFLVMLIKKTLAEEEIRKKLQKAYKELKKLDEAKTEFISIASHQLRTPLTAIKGYISLINEKIYGKPPKRMKKPLDNIHVSTERLIKLVADLLNISRIEAGKVKLNIEKVKLEDIIDSVVNELRNLAKEKKLYLKWEKPKTPLPKVLVDKDRIRQVILNVVDNGIRYTERGGVTIRYRKGDKMSKLIVSDTGEGMTKKEMSNLFRSFTRGSIGQRTWTEGTGLGLYIAKKFLDLHEGKIWAKSPGKGKGSTFYIELPTE